MYEWESKELLILKEVRDKISAVWNHTELNVEEVSGECLRDELKKISDIVNDLVLQVDLEVERLIIRDCDLSKDYTCSHCEGDKIYVCDSCTDIWSKEA